VILGVALAFGVYAAALSGEDSAPQALSWHAAQSRLFMANQLAKSKGDDALAEKIRDAAVNTKQWIDAGNPYRADEIVRQLEAACGLDPGGKTMAGVPIFHPTIEMAEQLEKLEEKLDQALRAKDKYTLPRVIATMRRVMGDQAGLPAVANAGWRVQPSSIGQAEAVDLFLAAVASERQKFTQIATGNPLPETRVRYYAEVVIACSEIRDVVKKHRPKVAADLDKIVAGGCNLMLLLQQPQGYFPTPDPKNKMKWMTAIEEDGGTQFDTGEAGVALLVAGIEYAKPEWLAAGLKAADWAADQPCVRNFSYNAQSLYLLATAHKVTRNKKYLKPALEKWDIGLAPGLLPTSGRWLDPHNARTAYHLINLRALTELTLDLPPLEDYVQLRGHLSKSVKLTAKAALDEFERYGVTNTSYALPALWRVQKLDPAIDPRLDVMVRKTAAATITAGTRDGKTTFGSSPMALSDVARVCP
jgi:hypothetical protein